MIQNCAPRVRRSAARPAPSGSRSCHAGFGDWCPLEPYNALPHRSDTQKNQANHFMATSGANVGKGNRRTSHAAVWTILLSCGGGAVLLFPAIDLLLRAAPEVPYQPCERDGN